MPNLTPAVVNEDIQRILQARHYAPFRVLGKHPAAGDEVFVRTYLPHAVEVALENGTLPMTPVEAAPGLFEWTGPATLLSTHYRIHWRDNTGHEHSFIDPYCFNPQISEFDLHLINEGKHWHAYKVLGAHAHQAEGVDGMLFAVWAPGAERVSVVGDFNRWDGRYHPMQTHGGTGIWELFIPELSAGTLYKFELRNRDSGAVMVKIDPYAHQFEQRPLTACITTEPSTYDWGDAAWLAHRAKWDWQHAPMSIYEVHLGSWQRDDKGEFLSYRALADRLTGHVTEMGFTHVELLPITEHPLDASWGYQTTGYYAPTSRFGKPDDLRYLIDRLHQAGIGVLLDWVPGHFPKDAFALARYDGTALYEHEDPRLGEHRDWGTLIFNYGRNEVRNFLVSSAMYWVEEFHIDGLRVDAVASMLYLDYSRKPGDWIPNKYGGRENLEAIDFLRELNATVQGQHPGALIIAEESTAWPQVTQPPEVGGLGFAMKWNMGWMHDILEYFKQDPVHRKYHHDQLTFGLLYAFTENFVLPFSHDEVVHGKRSLLYRMPGDEWQRFANLRTLYAFMYAYPGKKLLFMGSEFGQGDEWNFDGQLDWYVCQFPFHEGVKTLVRDLNRLYREHPALHAHEFEWQGFDWIDCHDAAQSVLSFVRRAHGRELIILCNFTPVPRMDYRIGIDNAGTYREVLNSDSEYYGGSNTGNSPQIQTRNTPWMGREYSLDLVLPPLGVLILERI
ncbi:1,4-alpha-glucan branching protein GlgB [Acidihalobacter ferrooxydans]|uniref:1,4-alpha-glucan branching enzyme GlgB n=1 Tax=Acidihalobacter ferrooxydans TaxID=1765967 RepID=A0A1P8UHH1_9GAMM|nr:1,4-alpha-glucan branching protein GlgB [Acidihalobacter ferrooxydans]APZ43221.1 1,4-alpha-glucan branching enzyme [Acidihalobacter ferrooxydans]